MIGSSIGPADEKFTGDKDLEVPAGTCSCSLYKRKVRDASDQGNQACGVGEWEPVWLGRTDFMPGGEERNWDVGHICTACARFELMASLAEQLYTRARLST